MNEKYTLSIISKETNKKLKKYFVKDNTYVGVKENEVFHIQFKNNTDKPVEISLSLDGVNILSGKKSVSYDERFHIRAHQNAVFKCYPETNKGGAEFVFTHTENSVAKNLINQVSKVGQIQVCVYEEAYVDPELFKFEPLKLINETYSTGPKYKMLHTPSTSVPLGGAFSYASDATITGETLTGDSIACGPAAACYAASGANLTLGNTHLNNEVKEQDTKIKTKASIGAGSLVKQEFGEVKGFRSPFLTETIVLNYMWWGELEEMIEQNLDSVIEGEAKSIMSLKNVPRIETSIQARTIDISRFEE